jgi:hypothetical protein
MLKQLLSKLVLPTLEQVRCVLMISTDTCALFFRHLVGWVVLYPSFVQFSYILSHHIYSHTHTVYSLLLRTLALMLLYSVCPSSLTHSSLLYTANTIRFSFPGSITYGRSRGSQDGQHHELLCTIRVRVPTKGPHGIEWCVWEYG